MNQGLKLIDIFRRASISLIHVGESVSESVGNFFEILSNLGHLFRVCPDRLDICRDRGTVGPVNFCLTV